ncbi:MPN555 family protein chaperone [Candidatus Mycoplasma haematohominis]|uniref:MPN555 family protein chaperone n=1 Tax=Candidatus Mycoplasma haematohominis TaxID=1494318 RepID=UPI001C0A7611|nr:hypothetical protein [Candidatus Mycoplasma haemohominis]
MKSRISNKKPIKFGQVLTITNFSSPNVDDYAANLRKQKPGISHEDLNREILELVKRDSYYNALMDEVASAYEFELDEDELRERMESVLQANPSMPVENVRNMVSIPIYKKLIYDDLAKDWEVSITDEVVKDTLEQFYRETGQPIREYLMDKIKFEGVRSTLVEQLITGRLMNAFKPVYKFPEQ